MLRNIHYELLQFEFLIEGNHLLESLPRDDFVDDRDLLESLRRSDSPVISFVSIEKANITNLMASMYCWKSG